MGNFTWFIDCTAKNAKVNLHAIVTVLKDNYYFDRFEDLLSKKYNYSKKMDILRNLDKLKSEIPEFITFGHFCSVVLNDRKLYGYIGEEDPQTKHNKEFIDALVNFTEFPSEGASLLMYYEGFGPVAFIFPQDEQWYTMMGYSNWSFNYYFYNLIKSDKKCDPSEKEDLKKEEPQIRDFIQMFSHLESNPEYFLRRGFKKDSAQTYLETFRLMGFSDEMIMRLHQK